MWWQYVIMAVVAIVVVYAFVSLTGFQTRRLTGKTDRTAQDMYDSYADSPGKQRRYARRRGGEWRDE
jgi:type II secretory pathway component PulL